LAWFSLKDELIIDKWMFMNLKTYSARECDKKREVNIMTQESIYCPVCFSSLEHIGKVGWVLCPLHGIEKAEVALSIEDILRLPLTS
jgi:hypothetical protein